MEDQYHVDERVHHELRAALGRAVPDLHPQYRRGIFGTGLREDHLDALNRNGEELRCNGVGGGEDLILGQAVDDDEVAWAVEIGIGVCGFLIAGVPTGGARTDVSVRDVLDPAFQYQLESIQVDNSVAECVAAICDTAEELAIFTAVNGASVLTDALGDDVVSYAAATIDAGNGNVGNLQLDINANTVWAILFSVKMP